AVAFSFRIPVRYTRDHYELRMPLVVGPRYIPPRTSEVLIIAAPGLPMLSPTPDSPGPDSPGPGSPDVAPRPDAPATPGGLDQDALRISPPYRHPSEGSTNPVALTVALSPGFDLAKLESPSHPVTVEKNGDTYRIALAEDVPADRDFVLTWIPEQGAAPSAAALSDAGADGTYVRATVLPPDAGADAPAPPPREVVFVIDISGSMGGTSIGQAKAALLYALDRLRPGDRFNVIAFNDKSMPLFTEPRAVDEPALAAARGFVTDLEADGGTEMAEPLASALTGDPPAGYLRQIVFLTDGSVGNEAQLFGLIVRNLKTARLFMVGIGSAPNGFFMTKAAETGRGASIMISDVGQVKERMAALIRKLESPAMTDLAVTWGDGVKGEMYPSRLPDLYTGEPLTFVVRLDGPGSTLHIAGKRGGVAWSADVAPKPADPESGIDKLWAAKKIDGLMSTAYEGADRAAIHDAVVTLGLKHQLLTRYTSLVAIERGSSRPEDAPMAKGAIPLNMPAGWDYEKVFGSAMGIAPASLRRATAPPPQASASVPAAAPLPAAQDVKVGVALGQGATPAGVNTLAALGLLGLAWLVYVVRRKTA
ncbi:MAG: VWA domain-containing protein, partial [Alphaproteobacteria bacterium]